MDCNQQLTDWQYYYGRISRLTQGDPQLEQTLNSGLDGLNSLTYTDEKWLMEKVVYR